MFFQKFAQSLPDSRLILIGDGELFTAIERKVNSLDLSNKVVLVVSVIVKSVFAGYGYFYSAIFVRGFPVS